MQKLEVIIPWATFIVGIAYEVLAIWYFRFEGGHYHQLVYYYFIFALFYFVLSILSLLSIAAIVIMIIQKTRRIKISRRLWLVVLCNLAVVINFILAILSQGART